MARQYLIKKRKNKALSGERLVRAFYNFYVLNELYFNLAGGLEEYGYARSIFISGRAEEKIKETALRDIPAFYLAVVDALERSVRSEIRYGLKWKKDENLKKAILKAGLSLKAFKSYRRHNIPLDVAKFLFSQEYLYESGYGGLLWAKATEALIEAKKARTYSEMVYHTDRILDMQHNNGFLLDKTEFEVLTHCPDEDEDDWNNHLDIRAAVRSIKDFEKHVSFYVRKLLIPQYHKLK